MCTRMQVCLSFYVLLLLDNCQHVCNRDYKTFLNVVLFQVLFWGLREPRRIQLLSVDRPRIEVQCGCHTVRSCQIRDFQQNSNFDTPLVYIDLVGLSTFDITTLIYTIFLLKSVCLSVVVSKLQVAILALSSREMS